jgi:DNA-binding winged helix-turn-helix (wHTH) protein
MMTSRSLQFTSFRLDLDRLCLYGPSGQADLRPKSFEVLRYLAENAGRVVRKDELIKAIWPDVTVTDESLTVCVSEVRRALGDERHRIIKTVPRRGYLFDVPVSASATVGVQASQIGKTSRAAEIESPTVDVPRHAGERIDHEILVGERKHVTVLCADVEVS